ncbi:hypothetical protein IC582_028907 [Cucumis melo]
MKIAKIEANYKHNKPKQVQWQFCNFAEIRLSGAPNFKSVSEAHFLLYFASKTTLWLIKA